MTSLTKAQIQKAMNQIINSVAMVKIPRLTEEEIGVYSRSRKRNARKRYHTLSFDTFDDDDEEKYFEMTCTEPTWYPEKKRSRRRAKEVDEVKPEIRSKTLEDEEEINNSVLIPLVKCDLPISVQNEKSISGTQDEAKKDSKLILKKENIGVISDIIAVETESKTTKFVLKMNTESLPKTYAKLDTNNSLIGKIRVKTPSELGCSVIFVENEDFFTVSHSKSAVPFQNLFPDLIGNNDDSTKTKGSDVEERLNIQHISKLYKIFFTPENQIKIKKVSEILKNLNENIKRKMDRLVEIKRDSKSTEAEKLMSRHYAHGQFNRVRETNEAALKEQFDIFGKIFDNENFEILFQLLFLGILKMFIVSVSNKKGTLFKTIVSLLLQSLNNSNYKDERVFKLLKSKTFRDDCIAMVQFVEKFSETKFFEMLFLSDSDKVKMLKKKGGHANEFVDIDNENNSCDAADKINQLGDSSIIINVNNLPVLPSGSNLLLQTVNHEQNTSCETPKPSVPNLSNSILFRHITDRANSTSSLIGKTNHLQSPHQSVIVGPNATVPINNNIVISNTIKPSSYINVSSDKNNEISTKQQNASQSYHAPISGNISILNPSNRDSLLDSRLSVQNAATSSDKLADLVQKMAKDSEELAANVGDSARRTHECARWMPDVNISQNSSLTANSSFNALPLSGSSNQSNTVLINAHQQFPVNSILNNVVPSTSSVRVSDSVNNSMISSRSATSLHTFQNTISIPVVNSHPFQNQNEISNRINNVVITSENNVYQPQPSSMTLVVGASHNNCSSDKNVNLFAQKTYGPAKGTSSKICPGRTVTIPEVPTNYSLNNNFQRHSMPTMKINNVQPSNFHSNLPPASIESAASTNVNRIPQFKIVYKNNENIKPNSIIIPALNKNYANIKVKNFNCTNYLPVNSSGQNNLRLLLSSNNTSHINQNRTSSACSTVSTNPIFPQLNLAAATSSNINNTMIETSNSLPNYSAISYNCWNTPAEKIDNTPSETISIEE